MKANELVKLLFDCGYKKYPESYEGDAYYCYLCLAQRWLREVKGWDILIRQFEFNKRQKEDGSWEYPYLCELHTKYGKHETFAGYTDAFYKYEEAQEAGIKKVLEIILEKGE